MEFVDNDKLHVLFLPYLSPSHMIPLVNAARLFAAQGVKVTILSTKYNTVLFQSSIDHAIELGHDITIHNLKFPSAEVGLPEGIEYFTAATTKEMLPKVHMAVLLLQKPMEELVQHLNPHCIISDKHFFWTCDLAQKLNIPRILFYPESFISHCLRHNLRQYEPHKSVSSDSESFLIPGLPNKIEMKKSQLEDHMKETTPYFEMIVKPIKESELRSFGLLFDTFYELDSQYADYFEKVRRIKFWTIGPLFYFSNKEKTDITADGKESCLNWLDSQGANQVLYVSFGSVVRFSTAQLKEIALALEASNQPFIWVVKKRENDQDNQQESWLPDGFEERMTEGNKGLIIRGWAPQLKTLNLLTVGGFMTHCGWNSTMEAMTAGVPLITWPVFSEQFYNEKLVQVLKVGVGVGADHWNLSPINEGPVVESKQIEEAISLLMSNSEESQKIRKRAKKMAALAKGAVEESGSSYQNLLDLIGALKKCAFGVKS
ncbi:nuatigenin 3-beta-glucosyltransferase-like [Coffea arabica]|uniref:Nuatigenin 3-beta-glucosyltransferase-like n=1 Tax=Coffea arabica TaxID=13443 RepID=A0A6P6X214_COFAR